MISVRDAKKILKAGGAKRVSKAASLKFKKALELYARQIAQEAIKKAQFAGRKSIKAEDIKDIES